MRPRLHEPDQTVLLGAIKGNVEPTLLEAPRRWVMIDVDSWPLPGWADLADDPEGAIDAAVHELLPEAFHDVRCWWQLSASAGFAPGFLKVHLFFWLSEPAANAHIKAVLEQHAPGIDRAPFSAAQPHYIAAPIIDGGHDPLPRRTGWRQGLEDVVVLPALRPVERAARVAGSGATGRGGDEEDALRYLGHGEGGQGFHEPIRTAVMRYARRCVRDGDRDDEVFKAWLRDRIRSAPCKPGGNVEEPYCQDYYLDSSISGARAKLAGDAEIQTMRPHHEAPTQTVEEAREAVREHAAAFLTRAAAWNRLGEEEQKASPPEHAALIVTVGGGKSTLTRKALPAFIKAMKADRLCHRVLWLVPTLTLADETLAVMQALGIRAAVFRGRDAIVPDAVPDPDDDAKPEQMCLDLEAAGDALAIGAPVEQAVCGSDKDGAARCPFRASCRYQAQKAPVARADVVITSHQSLFHQLPRAIKEGLGVVIVDESWWQAGLAHRDLRAAEFGNEPLAHPVVNKEKSGGNLSASFRYVRSELDTADLHAFSVRAQAVFLGTEEGCFVSRAAVVAAGLTAEHCALAHTLEWRRKVEGLIYPGMSAESRREAVEAGRGNATIPRRAAIWKALEELIRGEATHTGRLQAATRKDKEGTYQAILLHTRAEVRDTVGGLPILYLDATAPMRIVRHFLPRMEVLAEVQAAAPHMRVHQVVGGWGKTSLVPSPRAAPEENRRREGLCRWLADFVALKAEGNGMVITYQAIEQTFAEHPGGLRTAHFNAQRGLDVFGNVRAIAVVGRPLPQVLELRDMALALTGRAVPLEDGRQETRGVLMADGTGAGINVRAYEDEDLEALRVAITEAEVIQAIGRGRGVNRTADNPLDVFLFADVVAPLPVDRLIRWDAIRPGVVERMWARGAVLLSPVDATEAYPDLFGSANAAQLALRRAGSISTSFPYDSTIHRGMTWKSPVAVSYRPTGRGQQTRTAWVPADRLSGFRAQLVV